MSFKETIAVQHGLLRLAKLLGGTSTESEVRSAMNNVMSDIGGAMVEERQRAEEPSAAPGFTGHLTGTPALAFETSDGAAHVVSIDYTLRLLKRLYDEWPGGLEEIASAMSARTQDFKNFHLALCERFGYVHDEQDWRRDQVSLIEHIAKGMGPAAQAAMRTLTQQGYTYHGAELWKPPIGKSIAPTARFERDDMTAEAVAACLGDDAEMLRGSGFGRGGEEEFPEEVFTNMKYAAALLSYDPLSHQEMRDLTSMVTGAPFSDENVNSIVMPIIRTYEAVRSMGKRPIEIIDMPPDYWDLLPERPECALPPIDRAAPPQPAPGQWVEWDGTVLKDGDKITHKPECPVPRRTMTTVRFRDGSTQGPTEDVQSMRWAWTRPYVAQSDIVAYMIDDFQTPF